jgi:hypothetical protein
MRAMMPLLLSHAEVVRLFGYGGGVTAGMFDGLLSGGC